MVCDPEQDYWRMAAFHSLLHGLAELRITLTQQYMRNGIR
jgi:hypothetical protein